MIPNTYINAQDTTSPIIPQIDHNVSLKFLPNKETLAIKLIGIQSTLMQAAQKDFNSIKILANSGLILLLIPLLIPVKDRLIIEFCFETDSNENLYNSCYKNCRNFKDILEAANVLTNIGIEVSFNKTIAES